MKIATVLTSFFFVVAAASNVIAQPSQVEFEVTPGCLWSKGSGRCVVQNNLVKEITCEVEVVGKTQRGLRIGNVRQVVVPAGKFDDSAVVFAAEGDTILSVRSFARCKVPT